MGFIAAYLFSINTVSYILMSIDKKRAVAGRYRISEKTLWISSILGGSIGSLLAMQLVRHKTRHTTFRYGLPVLAVFHIILLFLSIKYSVDH